MFTYWNTKAVQTIFLLCWKGQWKSMILKASLEKVYHLFETAVLLKSIYLPWVSYCFFSISGCAKRRFTTFHHIFSSITFSHPTELKKTNVSPLYKEGATPEENNHRPNIQLNVWSKISERAMFSRVLGNFILYSQQFGFHKTTPL